MMNFSIYVDTIVTGLPICMLKGHRWKFLNYDAFLSLKVVLILTNSADLNEMPHNSFVSSLFTKVPI